MVPLRLLHLRVTQTNDRTSHEAFSRLQTACATQAHGKGGVTVRGRTPLSLETYRKHRPPLAHDLRLEWEAAEQAWERGVRRALLVTLIVFLLTLFLVILLPLVLVSG